MRISLDDELLLAELFEEMRVTATTLLSALETERQALHACDYQALDEAGAGKQTLVQELETLDSERLDLVGQLLNDAPVAERPDVILELVPAESKAAANWKALLGVLGECRDLNTLNGKIVGLRQHQLQMTLDLLYGSSGEPCLYGSTGEVRRSAKQRSISRA